MLLISTKRWFPKSTCQGEVKDAVSSLSLPQNKHCPSWLSLSADSKTSNWTLCTLNSQARVVVAYIHFICTHTHSAIDTRHASHPRVNLRVADSPGGLASLLTVVVYTYKHSKTLASTCILKLKPPTQTCWKWSGAQSETRVLHARNMPMVHFDVDSLSARVLPQGESLWY